MVTLERDRVLDSYSRVESLALRAPRLLDNPEARRTLDQVESIERDTNLLFDLAIQELSLADVNIRSQVEGVRGFSGKLEHIGILAQAAQEGIVSTPLSPEDGLVREFESLRQTPNTGVAVITSYLEHTTGLRLLSPIVEMDLAVKGGQYTKVAQLCAELKEYADDPRVLWHTLLKDGEVDPSYEENFAEILDLIELGKISQVVASSTLSSPDKKTLLAKVLLEKFGPKSERAGTINPILMEEVALGNFDFSSDFAEAIVDAYLGLIEEEKREREREAARVRAAYLLGSGGGWHGRHCGEELFDLAGVGDGLAELLAIERASSDHHL